MCSSGHRLLHCSKIVPCLLYLFPDLSPLCVALIPGDGLLSPYNPFLSSSLTYLFSSEEAHLLARAVNRPRLSFRSAGRMVSVAPWKAASGVVPRLRDAEGYRIRAAGVCIKGIGPSAEVLLVSTGKDKWAIPGGGVESNENHEEAAIRELEEEAGVRADALERIGVVQDDVKRCRTTVFLMSVREELDEWQESQFGRRRIWVPVAETELYMKKSHRPILNAVLAR